MQNNKQSNIWMCERLETINYVGSSYNFIYIYIAKIANA
jgi:hypothetical protein